jgi:hypothetical protein
MVSEQFSHRPLCANRQRPGGAACSSCRLATVSGETSLSRKVMTLTLCAQYCSKACQTTHYRIHKHDCKSPLVSKSWVPAWVIEGRQPVLLGQGGKAIVFNRKYLFGNMPARDVLDLEHNEGGDCCRDLKLLFAGEWRANVYFDTAV